MVYRYTEIKAVAQFCGITPKQVLAAAEYFSLVEIICAAAKANRKAVKQNGGKDAGLQSSTPGVSGKVSNL